MWRGGVLKIEERFTIENYNISVAWYFIDITVFY